MITLTNNPYTLSSIKKNQLILEQIQPCNKDEYKNKEFAKLTYFGQISQKIGEMI